ncbi:MAG: hypothetical protein Q9160_008578 [Pyrenula sp. 1 TL-2023]
MATVSARQPDAPYRQEASPNMSRTVNGNAYKPAQRRRQWELEEGSPLEYHGSPPPVPDVPRGPPLSYKDPYIRDSIPPRTNLQKSFSERAKVSPMPNEEYVEDSPWGAPITSPTQHAATAHTANPVQNSNSRRNANPQTQRYHDDRTRKKATKEIPNPRVIIPNGSAPLAREPSLNNQSQGYSDYPRHTDMPYSPVARSATVRDNSNGSDAKRREWAPDRSPLQKLEVTLNDISKEEKRARVEEAEMLLRESRAGRGGGKASKDTRSRPLRSEIESASGNPRDLEEAGLVRSLSGAQREKLQHSSTLESQRPDLGIVAGEPRRGFRYEEQQAAVPPVQRPSVSSSKQARPIKANPDEPVRVQRAQNERPVSIRQDPNRRPAHGSEEIRGQNMVGRSHSARQAVQAQGIPSNITRAVSMAQSGPQATFPDEREIPRGGPMKESNSSHKAVLTESAPAPAVAEAPKNVMTSNSAAAHSGSIGRSNSRKLQKRAPAGYANQAKDELEDSSAHGQYTGPEQSAYMAQRDSRQQSVSKPAPIADEDRLRSVAVAAHQHPSHVRDGPHGLGLQDHSTAEAEKKHHFPDVFHHKSRRQSVSFKEPFDRARPVNEWKNAGIARLTSTELQLSEANLDRSKAWWEEGGSGGRRKSRTSGAYQKPRGAVDDFGQTTFNPPLQLKCGPLLRYTGMKTQKSGVPSVGVHAVDGTEMWRGSVMIVTQDSLSSYETVPTLRLFSQPKELLPPPPSQITGDEGDLAPEYVDPLAGLTKMSRTGKSLYVKPVDHLEEGKDLSLIESDDGLFEESPSPIFTDGGGTSQQAPVDRNRGPDGEDVGRWSEVTGVRLYADPARDVTFWRFNLEIELGDRQAHIAYRINNGPAVGFWVPARGQAMNIMFHSCNGFSLSVNPNDFSGPDPLWRDVLNTHQTRPFHVMIGGGDQIYNDRVMVQTTHFGEWTKIKNPHEKHHAEFTSEMKEELETFYLDRYSMWFSQGLFGMANSQIPMVNIWDDHDIIDGFGSYPDNFMRTPVFSGLGEIAFKYYMLFQHQSVAEELTSDEPSWLLGEKPGPYIQQLSRSLFMSMGKSVAFLGLDCRTERTRGEILTANTLDVVLERCRRELIEGEAKHLIVLLGVPIAYPRLVWLENVLTSRAMDPIKAMGRYKMLKGGFLNKFDGGVEILDDLDDHWTASGHKGERTELIEDLQDLAAEKSVRITILGGDVHLAAIGQFYSKAKLKIPKDRDHRYIPNVISSAIVNTPPPEMMADVLNKRNKVHHFDDYTDEDMIPMFSHDVDGKKRNNQRLLPRRNWCSIREYHPGATPPPTPPASDTASESEGSQDYEEESEPEKPRRSFSFSGNSRPANLLRRLSGRAPPTSYRDASYRYDGPTDRHRPTSSSSLPTARRPNAHGSANSSPAPPVRRASFDPHMQSGITPRPIGNFQRRPTNLSEKAAKKGGGVGVNGEGDVINDHINLTGGLDIVLNCEVNQRDPAGITTPYRLLVPALWYDGTSDWKDQNYDEEMEGNLSGDEAAATAAAVGREGESGVKRRPTLLTKWRSSFKRKPKGEKNSSLAKRQGKGNWGGDMESESESRSDEERRDEDGYTDTEDEEEDYSDGESVEHPLPMLQGHHRQRQPQYQPQTPTRTSSAAQQQQQNPPQQNLRRVSPGQTVAPAPGSSPAPASNGSGRGMGTTPLRGFGAKTTISGPIGPPIRGYAGVDAWSDKKEKGKGKGVRRWF